MKNVIYEGYKYLAASLVMFFALSVLSNKFDANILDTFGLIMLGGIICLLYTSRCV